MKKILLLIITCLLLSSFILTACNGNNNENSTDSSQEESVETTSNDVTSQVGAENSDITDETSEVSDETSITEDSSIPQENSEQDESSRPETLYYDNANVADAVRKLSTHDYCVCGSEYYDILEDQTYDPAKHSINGRFPDFLIEYGYTTREELDEYVSSRYEMYANDIDRFKRCDRLPALYDYIKHFGVKKEDYLEFRESQLEFYYEHGYGNTSILTDRDIEIVFGDYDKEIVMKELKTGSSFYFEGALYTVNNLAYYTDDETIKRMLETQEFQLWLFDIEQLTRGYKSRDLSETFFDRINALKAEMENE